MSDDWQGWSWQQITHLSVIFPPSRYFRLFLIISKHDGTSEEEGTYFGTPSVNMTNSHFSDRQYWFDLAAEILCHTLIPPQNRHHILTQQSVYKCITLTHYTHSASTNMPMIYYLVAIIIII